MSFPDKTHKIFSRTYLLAKRKGTVRKMKRMILQIVICALLAAGYGVAWDSDIPPVRKAAQAVSAELNREYTVADLKQGGEVAVQTITRLPTKLSQAFEDEEYGEPIDEAFSGDTALVYAVGGGTVTTTGTNGDIGNYVVISHGGASESIYGNLSQVKVAPMQKIKKGDIIGSFDKRTGKEFYYSISEK